MHGSFLVERNMLCKFRRPNRGIKYVRTSKAGLLLIIGTLRICDDNGDVMSNSWKHIQYNHIMVAKTHKPLHSRRCMQLFQS